MIQFNRHLSTMGRATGFAGLFTSCRLVAIVAVVLSTVTHRSLAAENSKFAVANDSIIVEQLRRHVEVLADDSFEGREAGSRGGQAASIYLRKALSELGIEPAGQDGDFFQYFNGRYRNILGMVRGSDPLLDDEFIVVGAHYDHVGYGNRKNSYGPLGYIHNGADDNASGTSALLEVAEAFAKIGESPRRSVLFAFWDGEEKGLLGSKYFVNNPVVSTEKIRFFINMDMVGRLRDEQLLVYGSRSALGSRRLVSTLNGSTGLRLDFTWELKNNSDHYSFFERTIPVLMFHTGLHPDYHRPRDDSHKINAEGMQRVAQLVFRTTYELAQLDQPPTFRKRARYENPSRQREAERPAPALPKRFGISWNPLAAAQDGVVITRVRQNSPANRAGLLVGDRIVSFAGEQIRRGDRLQASVIAASNPVEVIVQRSSGDEELTTTVELDGRPHRLGIGWRVDEAEPGTLIINRVVAGSPADRAGVQLNDRVYRIAGKDFAAASEFVRIAKELSGAIDLLIESEGRLRTVKLDDVPAVAVEL